MSGDNILDDDNLLLDTFDEFFAGCGSGENSGLKEGANNSSLFDDILGVTNQDNESVLLASGTRKRQYNSDVPNNPSQNKQTLRPRSDTFGDILPFSNDEIFQILPQPQTPPEVPTTPGAVAITPSNQPSAQPVESRTNIQGRRLLSGASPRSQQKNLQKKVASSPQKQQMSSPSHTFLSQDMRYQTQPAVVQLLRPPTQYPMHSIAPAQKRQRTIYAGVFRGDYNQQQMQMQRLVTLQQKCQMQQLQKQTKQLEQLNTQLQQMRQLHQHQLLCLKQRLHTCTPADEQTMQRIRQSEHTCQDLTLCSTSSQQYQHKHAHQHQHQHNYQHSNQFNQHNQHTHQHQIYQVQMTGSDYNAQQLLLQQQQLQEQLEKVQQKLGAVQQYQQPCPQQQYQNRQRLM